MKWPILGVAWSTAANRKTASLHFVLISCLALKIDAYFKDQVFSKGLRGLKSISHSYMKVATVVVTGLNPAPHSATTRIINGGACSEE